MGKEKKIQKLMVKKTQKVNGILNLKLMGTNLIVMVQEGKENQEGMMKGN